MKNNSADTYNSHLAKAFRFISFEGLFSTIEFETLRFSRADTFNDPLDNSPFLMNIEWDKISKLPPNVYHYLYQRAFHQALGSLYICCFSKTYTSKKSYLMWSHYGQSHSQVCFEIDFSKHRYCGGPSRVNYVENLAEERAKYRINSDGLGLFLVTTKSNLWEYEQEVRLVIESSLNAQTAKFKKTNQEKNLDVPFDIKMISKVIFGLKASKENVYKTIKLFKEKDHDPTFEKMIIDPTTLEPEFVEFRE